MKEVIVKLELVKEFLEEDAKYPPEEKGQELVDALKEIASLLADKPGHFVTLQLKIQA